MLHHKQPVPLPVHLHAVTGYTSRYVSTAMLPGVTSVVIISSNTIWNLLSNCNMQQKLMRARYSKHRQQACLGIVGYMTGKHA